MGSETNLVRSLGRVERAFCFTSHNITVASQCQHISPAARSNYHDNNVHSAINALYVTADEMATGLTCLRVGLVVSQVGTFCPPLTTADDMQSEISINFSLLTVRPR
jgi:hypothetical protein